MAVSVKLGFVPSYRRWSDWTRQVREESIQALTNLPGVEVVAPVVGAPEAVADSTAGATAYGAVHTLDEAEAIADYFTRERVDGVGDH